MAQDESGDWQMWRVGRRRLAWRPKFPEWAKALAEFDFGPLTAMGLVIGSGIVLISWIAALCATVAIWPWRGLTGSWPVVAYVTESETGVPDRRRIVAGRAEADALVRRWAEEIRQYGAPREASVA